MTGTCQYSLGQRSGEAAWSYDGLSLVVTPQDAGPLTFAVEELSGLAGDDYEVKVVLPGGAATPAGDTELVLARLGHDGPTLREALDRDWLKARTEVLRIGGSGEGRLMLGQVAGLADGAAVPFRAVLYDDVLVIACEGRDLEPVFMALVEKTSFDEATYAVHLEEWPDRSLTFSKLAKQTDEFVKRLDANRALLAGEAAATLAATVPGLPAQGRAALASEWLPGRLMRLSRMETLCPGFGTRFCTELLPSLPRHDEGAHLVEWASPQQTWLGCTREQPEATPNAAESRAAAGGRPLWMLAGKRDAWFLEPLSIEDHATYCFRGGDEVPVLVSRLLCAPQFSKEALYSPVAELTGDNAKLAIPAACMGFLVQLRARFAGRVIHQSLESWRVEVERLSR